MKPENLEKYSVFEKSLEELIKIYRHLLGVVRKERDILITSNLDELNENNKTKEAMLIKARHLEEARLVAAQNLAQAEGLPTAARLVDFVNHFGGERGERLRNIQSVLELLLKRVKEHNSKNEVLVSSALDHISGAMGSIRETLSDKPTYKKNGDIKTRTKESGQLVSKEA